MIYLDNAATTGKKPPAVIDAVGRALRELCANPGRSGHDLSQKAAMAVYDCRRKAAQLFGASAEDHVVFTANCTQAVNFVLKGLLEPGDHVVTSSLEHNAVMRPLFELQRTGVEVDAAEVFLDDPEATARSFKRLLRPTTKLAICTWASNVLGVTLPVEAIGECCRERGVLFAVDAAQAAGVFEIDMRKQCIDYLCVAPHKGLYAPMGTGLLLADAPLPKTIIEGGTGSNSASPYQPDDPPERFESGTLNLPGVCGIAAGIDFIAEKGVGRIYAHEMKLTRQLYDALGRVSGIRLYTPRPADGLFAPVLSFNLDGHTSEAVAAALNRRGFAVRAGLHCAPSAHRRIGTIDSGAVRVSPSVYNSAQDIAAFADAVAAL